MTGRRVLVLVIVACVVCASAADARKNKKQRTLRLKVGPYAIQPHRDREICQSFIVDRVPGMEVVVAEARSKVGRKGLVGSHHLVAYGYTGESASGFPEGIVDSPGCNEFGPVDFYRKKVFLTGSGGSSPRGAGAGRPSACRATWRSPSRT